MLLKQNRLTKKKDFDAVYKKGRAFNDKALFLKIAENGFDFSRFGFVVSKKVSNKAVKRNKVKRALREIVRLKLKENEIKSGFDAVISAKADILNKDRCEIEKIIDFLFEKSKLSSRA